MAHAFGNIPLALHDWDVDFAVWCTYKYGNSSAGGIGGAFVHKRYGKDKRQRMLGWWAHRASTRFLMDNSKTLHPYIHLKPDFSFAIFICIHIYL